MKPFVLVTVEDNSVSDTTVVGDSNVEVIVVDFDTCLDADEAQDLIDQIVGKYEDESAPIGEVRKVLDKLEEIVDEEEGAEDEDEEDDEDFEVDDLDAEDDLEYSDDDDEEDIDLDDDEEADPEVADFLNNHGQGEPADSAEAKPAPAGWDSV